MAIEVTHGKVNVNGVLKEKGAKIKLSEAEEKRLINLGFAKKISEKLEIEELRRPTEKIAVEEVAEAVGEEIGPKGKKVK